MSDVMSGLIVGSDARPKSLHAIQPIRFGAVFPTTEIGTDPVAIRDWAQAAEELGYSRIVAFDHVLGADHHGREAMLGHLPYTEKHPFHEPLVLLGYLAAITRRIELATGVLVLGQRQAVLAAKQATQVDLLSGGRMVLGVGAGASPVEYEAMGVPYAGRFQRLEEQIAVMRALWREPLVDFTGTYHRIDRAGLLPQPEAKSIPVWIGGRTEPMYRRAARIGDGFMFGTDGPAAHAGARRLHELLLTEGRDPAMFPMDAYTAYGWGPDHWHRELSTWQSLGGTHLTVRTTDASSKVHGYPVNAFTMPQQHIDALRHFAGEMMRG